MKNLEDAKKDYNNITPDNLVGKMSGIMPDILILHDKLNTLKRVYNGVYWKDYDVFVYYIMKDGNYNYVKIDGEKANFYISNNKNKPFEVMDLVEKPKLIRRK